jgi:predicted PurR-regulated permease PerM
MTESDRKSPVDKALLAASMGHRLAGIDRTLRAAVVGAALVLAAWLLRDILLLAFAAVLIACVFHGTAEGVRRITGLGSGWSLFAVVAALFVGIVCLIWWRGPELAALIQQFADQLASQIERLWTQVENGAWGRRAAESLRHSLQSMADDLPGYATGVATSTLGIGGSLAVVLVTAICLAASPRVYVEGGLRLVPPAWRPRGREVLRALGVTLRLWCLGQLVDMLVVMLLGGIGLILLGVPLAPVLALLAGLANFVPFIGALAGAVPAVLIAWAQSPTLALWVAVLFVVVQTIEGYGVAPFVQKRTGTLPPALTIMSQTILGALFGIPGLILAPPVMAATLVALRMIYVESVLESGETEPSRPNDRATEP